MSRQTEFLQGLLNAPVGHYPRAAEPTTPAQATSVANGETHDLRAPDQVPMLDFLNHAYQINGEYMKRMIDAAPLVDGKAKETMRTLTQDVVEALAPTNFLVPDERLAVSNYHDIRDELRSGDIIVASKGNMKSFNNFLSLLIRVFTASSYSHVGVVIKLGNRCFVVEATPPVVRLYPLSKLDSFYVIKMEETLTKEDENRLFEYVGMPYSDWNSVASYFSGKPLANGKLQCAQLVSSFYNWPNLLRPEQIVKYAQEKLGKQMVFVR